MRLDLSKLDAKQLAALAAIADGVDEHLARMSKLMSVDSVCRYDLKHALRLNSRLADAIGRAERKHQKENA